MLMREQREQLLEEIEGLNQSWIASGDKTWPIDQFRHPNSASPEKLSFEPLLGEGVPFQKWLENRRAAGKNTHVLEPFGSAEFLTDSSIADSITGMRLLDVVYKDRFRPRSSSHNVLERDIYDQLAWNELDSHMDTQGIPAFDLAVCSPGAGWGLWKGEYDPAVILSIYYPMLQNIYNVLSPDEGTLFADIPPRMNLSPNDFALWESRMNRRNIKTTVLDTKRDRRRYIMQITRMPNSPEELVPLTGKCRMPAEG